MTLSIFLTHSQIWTMESHEIESTIESLKTAGETWEADFFALVLEYKGKLHSASQTNYPGENVEFFKKKINQFFQQIPWSEDELKIATKNLLAMVIGKLEKNYKAAHDIYSFELSLTSNSQARICLWTNYLSSYFEEKNPQIDLLVEKAKKESFLDESITKQNQAAFYCVLANIMAKKRKPYQQMGDVVELYQKALKLCPDNNVIANNFAIMLSKCNDQKALKLADTVLFKHYEHAKTNLLFVTLYYRADVTIKLASFASAEEREKLLQNAERYMTLAAEALESKKSGSEENKYSSYYITKGRARLSYLSANIASVRQNRENFEKAKAEAKQERDLLRENPGKNLKFETKIKFLHLFREREEEKELIGKSPVSFRPKFK